MGILLFASTLSGLNVPLESLEGHVLDELLLRSEGTFPIFPGSKPLPMEDLERALRRTYPRDETGELLKDRLLWRLGTFGGPGVDLKLRADSLTRFFASPYFILTLPRFSALAAATFKFGDSSEYPRETWRDFVAGDYRRGYAQIGLSSFRFLVGREAIRWGASPNDPTLISAASPTPDGFGAQYSSRKLKFSFFVVQLEPVTEAVNRFLSGHRLELKLADGLYMGLSEVVLQGTEQGLPDFYYFNPLLVFYVRQWNRNLNNDNILFGIDLNWYGPGFGAYLDFTVDDFPYEAPMNEHPKVAGNLGIRFVDPLGLEGTFLNFEYSMATKWTYGHTTHSWLRYTYLGYPIGHPEGNDFEAIQADLLYHLNREIDVRATFRSQRKGEGVLDYVWPPGQHFPDEFFLTGVLETSRRGALGISYFGSLAVSLDVGYTHVSNRGHIEGHSKGFLDVGLRLQYF
jgi:hypothetical protein